MQKLPNCRCKIKDHEHRIEPLNIVHITFIRSTVIEVQICSNKDDDFDQTLLIKTICNYLNMFKTSCKWYSNIYKHILIYIYIYMFIYLFIYKMVLTRSDN